MGGLKSLAGRPKGPTGGVMSLLVMASTPWIGICNHGYDAVDEQ